MPTPGGASVGCSSWCPGPAQLSYGCPCVPAHCAKWRSPPGETSAGGHYPQQVDLSFVLCVCVCVCGCVCVCVCVKAKCVDITARIATKFHTHTKNVPGKVFKSFSISWTYRKGRFSIARMGRSRCYGSSRKLQKCKNAVKCNLSSTHFYQPYVVLKLSIKEAQICCSGRIGGKTTKIWPLKLLGLKLRIFPLDEHEAFAFSRNDNFSATQLHDGIGKLSISRA